MSIAQAWLARLRGIRLSGSKGGATEPNRSSLPLSFNSQDHASPFISKLPRALTYPTVTHFRSRAD